MANPLLLEICVDHLESAVIAETGGANRLELCQALDLGGLTPSVGLIILTRANVSIPIFMMIRPRSGNFFYSADEVVQMLNDIKVGLTLNVDGFVTGALRKTDTDIVIDEDVCSQLIETAAGKPVTFHRAFDLMTCSHETAINDVIRLGFSRILTSGRATIAIEGLDAIRNFINIARDRIIIMPDESGSGLLKENVEELYRSTGAKEFHSSGTYPKIEEDEDGNPIVAGTTYYKVVDFHIVKALREILDRADEEDERE